MCFAERIACRTRNSNSVLPETVGAPVSIVEFNSTSLPVRKLQKLCCSGNLGTSRSGSNGCAIPSAGFLWMFHEAKATSIHRLLLPTGRKDIQEDRFVSSTVTRLINHRLLAVVFPQFISGNYRTITMFGQKLERFRFVLDKNGRHWI